MLAPLKENEASPGVALIEPPQVPTSALAGLAMIIPVGIVSVKATPSMTTLLGFTNSTLNVEGEPPKTVKGSNPFTTPIDKLPIVSVARAGCAGLMVVLVP